MSQHIIVCEVCESEPLQHFCNQCEVRLCNNCILTHLGSESVEGHTIVRFRYRDARNVTPRQCSTHQTEKKTLFCKNCEAQVCTKGLTKHLEHELTDLKHFIHSKHVDIVKDIDFLKTKVQPDFESGIEKLNKVYEEASTRFDKERQKLIDAEKDLHDIVTGAMKALLDEMETRKNETLTKVADLKKNIETKLKTSDEFIDRCEAAKTSLEDILTIKFDEALLDMEHSIKIVLPQYISPNKWAVDVGTFKSIAESRRIFEIDVENNIQLPVSRRVLQEKYKTEGNEEGEVFLDAKEKMETVNALFIENKEQQPLADLLENCHRYKTELQLGQELEEAQKEYQKLLQRTKETRSLETVSQMQKNEPPCELNFVNDDGRREAPMLYEIIKIVSEKCPTYNGGQAVREFITLTTYSKSEPQRSKNQQRPRSTSGYQAKTKKPQKTYRNSIEKLLDQDWQSDFIPKSAVEYDYRHFFTSENVLRSSFPDAYIFNLAHSTVSGPEDVPAEYRDRTLCAFLQTIDMKKLGVNPRDAWRDYGRCILAEKQLDLARRAVGPDLDKNVLINKQTYYKIQNELQEKTQEIEELSTSQQLTEGNPNIADLWDTPRPTGLGEMYSQLFDDEWSEAFEAFKPKKEEDEDDDEDIFPDTLFVLQNMLREAFEFCKSQSQIQMTELEDGFATIIGLKEPKSGEKSHEQTGKDEASNPEDKTEKPKVEKLDGEEERPDDGPDDITEVKEGQEQGPNVEEEIEDRTYRTDPSFPMIERHARYFRKAAAGTSAKTKSRLFIEVELPTLVKDKDIRADIRTLTYARKCVELCWYMCMQDPPMLIITPPKGEEVDKGLFSFHGRRGKTVEVCVWPALLLHDNGPLVCKGYVLPEERKRKK